MIHAYIFSDERAAFAVARQLSRLFNLPKSSSAGPRRHSKRAGQTLRYARVLKHATRDRWCILSDLWTERQRLSNDVSAPEPSELDVGWFKNPSEV